MSPSPSQVPVYGLLGCAVAALLLLGVAVWLGLQLRRTADRVLRLVQALLVGLAVAFVVLVLAGQRHYGGSVRGGGQACDVWYQEAGLPASAQALPGDLSASCRHDALAAIGPGIGWAALIGLVAAALFWAVAAGLRRWHGRARTPSGIRYVDVDG